MIELHPISDLTQHHLRAAGLDPTALQSLIDVALGEDLGEGRDVTTDATIAASDRSVAVLTSRHRGVVAGLFVASAVFERVGGSDAVEFVPVVNDGHRVSRDEALATVRGPTPALLTAERTALNFLCHLSGIATLTRRWADAIAGTRAGVRDTRKTTPGLRALEKYAVRCGGGTNHRMGLSDMALIKDNHVAALGSIAAAHDRLRSSSSHIPVEVEVDSVTGLKEAIESGAVQVLLDNFDRSELRAAVQVRDASAPHVQLEASGGLTLPDAGEIANSGVDWLAVGELTHSAPALDIGLDFVPRGAVRIVASCPRTFGSQPQDVVRETDQV